MEKARNAGIVGILVGTLGVAGYLQAIDRLRTLIHRWARIARLLPLSAAAGLRRWRRLALSMPPVAPPRLLHMSSELAITPTVLAVTV